MHILHLACTTSSADLCFNKKFEQEKKVIPINVDTYYSLFIKIVTECDTLSPSTKFSSLNHKTVVVLRV